MFVVTYAIKVRPDQRQPFSVCWRTIAEAKRDHCGSLGSRLFAQPDGTYVVFEEWPDRTSHEACAASRQLSGPRLRSHADCANRGRRLARWNSPSR